MRKAAYIVLFIVLLVLLVLCVLHGCFRKREELSDEVTLELGKAYDNRVLIKPTESDQQLIKQLWREHVDLTRKVIVGTFSNDPNLTSYESQLLINQEQIGSFINKYHPGSETIITLLFKEHILQARDILEDLKKLKLAKLIKDINSWYNNADKISNALLILNTEWKLKSHMVEHLRLTELEAIYEWLGLKDLSKGVYESKIEPQAQEIADHLISGLI